MRVLRFVVTVALGFGICSAGHAAPPASGKAVSCRMERICQAVPRPVREVVTTCAMLSPSPGFPPRKLCTEQLAQSERSGPELCRSTRICMLR